MCRLHLETLEVCCAARRACCPCHVGNRLVAGALHAPLRRGRLPAAWRSPHARREPDEIESSVIQALVVSPATESFEVDIEAEPDGSVLRRMNPEVRTTCAVALAALLTVTAAPGASREPAPPPQTPVSAATDLTSAEIEAAVLRELEHDPLIDVDHLEVDVHGGRVTLRGSQRLLLTRDRAAFIAEGVLGVRDVVNDITVRPQREVDSQRLESDVMYALLTDPATERGEIVVEAEGQGRVRLYGAVDSAAERHLAEQTAKSITGVRAVANEIEVRTDATRPDHEIAEDVRRSLQWDAYVDSLDIDVEARKGIVTLSGTVDSAAAKRRAFGHGWVAGVKHVNVVPLKIDPSAKAGGTLSRLRSDEAIETAVRRALDADPRLAGSDLDVAVNTAVVTLDGTVSNLRAKRIAHRMPFGLLGVAAVHDRVRVNAGIHDDDALAARAARLIARNQATADDAIEVDVSDGAVTLTGHAADPYSRQMAEQLAASVRGVHAVTNEIVVPGAAPRTAYDPQADEWSGLYYDWSPANSAPLDDDEAIVKSVRRELAWSPMVRASDIHVSADEGVVTLSGSVASLAERDAAIENAFEGGAASVMSRLDVSD